MALLANSVEGKAAPYLQRIENILAKMETRKGKYMAECKADREDIKEIYTEAKANGLPAKALKGLVRYRSLEKKQKAIADGLDIDEQSTYEQLVEALGDFAGTALGQATLDLAKTTGKGAKSGKGGGKKGDQPAAGADGAPDPDAVKARTQEELEEPIDELDRPFAERHRAAKDRDAAEFEGGGIGTTEATHQIAQ
jgi:uncharacterized protein (UPF0335 family)